MATAWDPVDMEKVAFHEAGHAIVGWLFGLPLKGICLDLEKAGKLPTSSRQPAACVSCNGSPSSALALSQRKFSRALPCLAAPTPTA